MSREYKGGPLGLTEILILLTIAAILGYVFIPRIHDYFYQQTAADIVTHYENTIAKVSAGIKGTPSGKISYFLSTKRHKGIIEDTDKDTGFKPALDSEYHYGIGHTLKKAGTIYFSKNAFFIPLRVRIIAHYFKQDKSLFMLDHSLPVLVPPLKTPIKHSLIGQHISQCDGYPIILTIGLNFKMKNTNQYTLYSITRLFRKDGYTITNNEVRNAFNANGDVCPA